VVADGVSVLPPSNVTHDEAAAIPYGGELAAHFLRSANIQPGQQVLAYEASAAIGTCGVQAREASRRERHGGLQHCVPGTREISRSRRRARLHDSSGGPAVRRRLRCGGTQEEIARRLICEIYLVLMAACNSQTR